MGLVGGSGEGGWLGDMGEGGGGEVEGGVEGCLRVIGWRGEGGEASGV